MVVVLDMYINQYDNVNDGDGSIGQRHGARRTLRPHRVHRSRAPARENALRDACDTKHLRDQRGGYVGAEQPVPGCTQPGESRWLRQDANSSRPSEVGRNDATGSLDFAAVSTASKRLVGRVGEPAGRLYGRLEDSAAASIGDASKRGSGEVWSS